MEERIGLGHGSGGRLTNQLVAEFINVFDNEILRRLEDSAVLPIEGRLAFTTDAFVVNPLFFPGGNIGSLAVTGTVNDLACVGARPAYLALALIIEEGFPIASLKRIIRAVGQTAHEVGVKVVAGDTKVVESGKADGLYITTTGCGLIPDGVRLARQEITPSDLILVNGPVGDHAAAVLLARHQFSFTGQLRSDAVSLAGMVAEIVDKDSSIHFIRDITRGGLATVLSEVVDQMDWGIEIREEKIPFRKEVLAVAEVLGLDPLYFACEGRMLFFVAENKAEKILGQLQAHPLGKEAQVIGRVVTTNAGKVILRTMVGGSRLLEPLLGEQLPRIC